MKAVWDGTRQSNCLMLIVQFGMICVRADGDEAKTAAMLEADNEEANEEGQGDTGTVDLDVDVEDDVEVLETPIQLRTTRMNTTTAARPSSCRPCRGFSINWGSNSVGEGSNKSSYAGYIRCSFSD
ncbi:hypothetical protein AMTRI_Chr05g74420 [Amborella trichopoda]